tara:strand:- start:977 stop:1909 length:933 start_codon:yes stop_codon:yes gene_type:complete
VSEEVPSTPVATPDSAVAAQPEPSQATADLSVPTGGAAAVPAGAPAVTSADDPWPTVEWDSWNGSVDTLPEQYHETVRGVRGYFERDFSDRAEEISNLRSMYAAMLSEEEDPRIGQLTNQLSSLQDKYEKEQIQYKELQERLSSTENRAVEEYVDRFWKDHADLSEDKEKLQVFSQFLLEKNDYGGMWDAYVAAELMAFPPEIIQVAVDAKKDGVSDQYALKLAKARAELEEVRAQPTGPSPEEVAAAQAKAQAEAKAKAPRTGAKITNGATRSSRPQVAKKSVNDADSLDEMRLLAARRAFSVHGGGRR